MTYSTAERVAIGKAGTRCRISLLVLPDPQSGEIAGNEYEGFRHIVDFRFCWGWPWGRTEISLADTGERTNV
jgi:hypothetical protein